MMAKCKQEKEENYNAVDGFQRYPLIFKKTRLNSNKNVPFCFNTPLGPGEDVQVAKRWWKSDPANSIFVCLLTLDNSYYQNMATSNKYSSGVKQRNESLDNIDIMPFDQYVLFSPTETPDKLSYSTKSN
jgi:hypothetical protein